MTVSKKFDRKIFRIWLLVVVVGFGVTLFTYLAVQQSLRLSLNMPQLQIAQDAANQLSQGASPSTVLSSTQLIDESKSLAPFMTIVDKNINVIATTGKIGDVTPLPPPSSFPDSIKRGNTWFTWQHDNNNVRDAAVIVPYGGANPGYVLVARSMNQTENIVSRLTILAGFTLLCILVFSTLIVAVV